MPYLLNSTIWIADRICSRVGLVQPEEWICPVADLDNITTPHDIVLGAVRITVDMEESGFNDIDWHPNFSDMPWEWRKAN